MVSILPPNPSPWQVIGKAMSQFGQNAPQQLEERFQRQRGVSAIDQLQTALQEAGGDINKMLPAIAKAYTMNPSLERSGLGQTYLNRALTGQALNPNGQNSTGQPGNVPNVQGNPNQNAEELPYKGAPPAKQPGIATPTPFNILTAQDIDQLATNYAIRLGDPNAKAQKQAELQNLNNIATSQRESLEDMALKANVTPNELPRFMQVGQTFDPRNPAEWLQNTKRAYQTLKNNDKKIERTFIPGLGSGLIGKNRDQALERLITSSQDAKKLGLESELREYYADQYMSPTEIERQFYPTPPQVEKSIQSLPKGDFPRENENMAISKIGLFPIDAKKTPSYLDMKLENPQRVEEMQNELSNFFLNNITEDTSLLDVTEKLWSQKDYDWKQFGPAIRQAMQQGLELNQRQSTELADVETQPPKQSLPDVFEDFFERFIPYLRGNR